MQDEDGADEHNSTLNDSYPALESMTITDTRASHAIPQLEVDYLINERQALMHRENARHTLQIFFPSYERPLDGMSRLHHTIAANTSSTAQERMEAYSRDYSCWIA